MSLRTTLLFIILNVAFNAFGQIADDFSDGEFTSNPIWTGDGTEWIIDNEQLRSNGPSGGVIHLSTANTILDYTIWDFNLDLNFNGTNSNFIRIYLTSDRQDLEDSPSGYFIQMGQTNADFVKFFRDDAGTETELLQSLSSFSSSTIGEIGVRVIRNSDGLWSLYLDSGLSGQFDFEGSVVDNTHQSTTHFGVYFQYATASRFDDFGFDDLIISQLEMDTVTVQSATEIIVYFNQNVDQTDAETVANYTIAGLTITNSELSTVNDSTVTLTLDPSTPLLSDSYDLVVGSGLTKNADASYNFNYQILDLESLLTTSDSEVKVVFNSELDPTSVADVSNYNIDNTIGQPTSASLEADGKTVVLALANSLLEGVNYELTVSSVSNLSQNSTFSGSSTFDFVIPLIANALAATSSQEVEVTFNKAVDEILAETLNNYSLDGGIGTPTSAELSADALSVALTFDTGFADATYSLSITNLQDLNGNTVTGSSPSFSYLNLAISSVEQFGDNGATLTFNQSLDQLSAETIGNYTLSEFGIPSSATRSLTDDKVVNLVWNGLYNSRYTLSITGVTNDLENSTLTSGEVSFSIAKASAFRELIINEIMADPSPAVGLPLAEYVEIFNPNTYSLSVDGFLLNGEELKEGVIPSGGYLLLTSTADSAAFGLTNSLGVSGFDALTNTGETITFQDQFGNDIDSVSYELGWYQDDEKDNGGYSLELINPLQPCSGSNNWSVSGATLGGTPGSQNAIFNDVDTTPPSLESLEIIGDDSLELVFSEPMDTASFVQASVSLQDYTVASLRAQSLTSFLVILSTDLVSERTYELVISDAKDCLGNTQTSQTFSFYHDTKAPVFQELIILSDQELALVFDESLEEFDAETESNYSIAGLTIDRALLRDTATNRVQLSIEESFSIDQDYQLLVAGIRDTLDNQIVDFNSDFTFRSDIDTLRVIAANILEVVFADTVESSSLSVSQFFLEDDEVFPTEVVALSSSPRTVRLAFEDNLAENRALNLFSLNIRSDEGERMVTPAYEFTYDKRAPNFDQLIVQNDSQIVVHWNEPMDILSATTSGFYTLEDGEQPIAIVAETDSAFELTFLNKFPIEETKELSSRGAEDISGNVVITTRREEFVYDQRAPIVSSIRKISDLEVSLRLNEPITLESATNLSNFSLDSTNPSNSRLLGPDSTEVILEFPSISEDSALPFTVSGLIDKQGNESAAINQTLNTQEPTVVGFQFKSDSSLDVMFSHAMADQTFDISNYYFSPFGLLALNELDPTTAELILSDKLQNGDSIELSIANAVAENGFELSINELDTVFSTLFSSYEIINDQTIELTFDTEFASIAKSSFALEENVVELVVVDGEDKDHVRISLANALTENIPYVLQWNDLNDSYDRSLPVYSLTVMNDTEAPVVNNVFSDFFGQLILTFSEPMESTNIQSINKYSIVSIGVPVSVTSSSDTLITLDFDNKLVSGTEYQLIVDRLPDVSFNYSLIDTISFIYEPPAIPSFGQVIITELLPDPSPSVGLPEVEYVELYNSSNESFDLRALTIGDGTAEVSLPSYIISSEAYVLLVAEGNQSLFDVENVVGVSGFQSLSNSADEVVIRNIIGDEVDFVAYEIAWYGDGLKDNGGYSLELIEPNTTCPISFNWSASNSATGGTPGIQNSIFRTGLDEDLPEIDSIHFVSSLEIDIVFGEAMDSLSLLTTNIDISILGVESLMVADQSFTTLHVTLAEEAELGIIYTIEVSGAKDCSGNVMQDTTLTLGIGRAPLAGDLVITEIMADPEPAVGLPASEYIELFNVTDDLIDLTDIQLSDATTSALLAERQLAANSYVILCPISQVDSFASFGQVIGLSSWPNLTNAGEQLRLDLVDELIDEVTYSSAWYNDSEKSDGGYSLEIINPLSVCPSSANWSASNSETGGTPGTQNSIYDVGPDGDLPQIQNIRFASDLSLEIVFDEAMDSLSLLSTTIEISTLSIASLSVVDEEYTTLQATLSTAAELGVIYTIELSGAKDCSGNVMQDTTLTLGIGRAPLAGDLVITEIMADPEPAVGLPASEYIELFNVTDDLIDLTDIQLSDATTSALLADRQLAANSYVILCPISQVDSFASFGQVIGLVSWPNLTNAGEQLILSLADELIDEVTYSSAWYNDSEKSDGGYSLEIINPLSVCPSSANWSASNSTTGGTPGQQNSIYDVGPDGDLPQVQNIRFASDLSLEIVFDEAMDSLSLLSTTIDILTLAIASLSVVDEEYTTLQATLSTAAELGIIYTIELSGAKDCSGNVMQDTTLTLGIGRSPLAGDLVITEIMADPEPAVGLPASEYIELFNVTDDLIDLSNVLLRDASSSRSLAEVQLASNSYIILCQSTQAEAFASFGNVMGLTSWPGLTNSGEEISLSVDGQVVDFVSYSSDWYNNADKSDGGYSLELINPFSPCPSSANWSASEDLSGGTPGRQNSLYSLNPDEVSPQLVSSEALDDVTLRFVFNESMDSLSLVNAVIAGVEIADRSIVGIDFTELLIYLSSPLPRGVSITVSIAGATDCSGNVMQEDSFIVGFGDLPEFNELLITEIMADPEPVFGLPNSEYLELYNASGRLITLDGLELRDGLGSTALPAVIIPPESYLLLLPTSSIGSFPFTDNKTGVSGWLSLANAGESLSIWNGEDLIFSITYDDDWYGSGDNDGGYSLEMRDVSNPCAGEINWGISISAEGGTPGFDNSNTQSIPDNFGPNLVSAFVGTSQSITLTFDETLDYNFRDNQLLTFEPELTPIASTTLSDRTLYIIIFEEELQTNVPYSVTISNVSDCSNNLIQANSAVFIRPDVADSLDLVINEVLFDPRTGGVDFVELYNRSDKYLDLDDFKLGRNTEDGIESIDIIDPYIMMPDSYVAITSDTLLTRMSFPQGVNNPLVENRLPTMPNDEGTIILLDSNYNQIDAFSYFDDFHLGLLESVDGVSLERISQEAPTQDGNNWTSAAASVGFATPGYSNSQSFERSMSTATVSIEPKVFVPESTNPAFESFTTINYSLAQAGQFANVTIYNQMGQPVAELARGTSLSTSGFLRWDGITDSGKRARMGYYVVLFEIFDSNGNQQVLKETVVVGR